MRGVLVGLLVTAAALSLGIAGMRVAMHDTPQLYLGTALVAAVLIWIVAKEETS